MFKKIIFTIAFICVMASSSFGQTPNEHHVYGVVVGISEYADKAIKDLKFADDDAIMFANFLKTQLVQPQDTDNIKLFTNKKATAIPVFEEIEKITKKAKLGDTVYFYFSGHGEANNPDEIFLICHDAAKGTYAVGGGCIPVKFLKNRIKIMQQNKVKVILITDACRSNEISDAEYNLIFTNALNENTGEIQLTSCSPNEKSFEDRRWGNGHGVFTWYLLKGWMGMADQNNNNRVTFEELSNYLVQHVGDDTYDKIEDRKLQIPSSCCPGYNNTLMGKVNPAIKKQLMEAEETGVDNLYAALMPRYLSRSIESEKIEDSLALEYYDRFNKLIDQEQFMEPDTNCAVFYYQKFKERQKAGVILDESRLDLVAGMANKAQSFIQDYLRGNDSITVLEFQYASRLMNQSVALMDTSNYMYKGMRARALFLEANSMMTTQNEMSLAFDKLDSSLMLEPNKAYVYYSKARIYEKFDVYFNKAEENYLKAIELAPKWVFPMLDLGNMYINDGQYTKGKSYFNKATQIQPGSYIFTLLGHTYQFMADAQGHYDTAIAYYQKALEIDSNYIDAILGIAIVNLSRDSVDLSVKNYLKALHKDTSYYFTYLSFGDLFYDAQMDEKSIFCYNKAVHLNPDCIKAHWMLGNIYDFRLEDKVKAVDEYAACLKIDYYYTKAYNAIGNIYITTEQFSDARNFLKYPLTYDPNYNPINLARMFLNRADYDTTGLDYDSAKLWLDSSNALYPNEYYTNYLYGHYYWKINNPEKTIAYNLASIKLKDDYFYSWQTLGHGYYLSDKMDSAYYCYSRCTNIIPTIQQPYQDIWNINQYKLLNNEKALEIADTAIQRNVNPAYFHFLKCYTYYQQKKYQLALNENTKAIELNPTDGQFIYYKALINYEMGNMTDVIKIIETALKTERKFIKEDFYGDNFKTLQINKKYIKIINQYFEDQNKQPIK